MFSKKMKCLLGMLSLGIHSLMAVAADKHPPHMDLEMTSAEYRALTSGLSTLESDDPLQAILEKGKRNLDWIEVINAARKPGWKPKY
jgi:hypothetical protein